MFAGFRSRRILAIVIAGLLTLLYFIYFKAIDLHSSNIVKIFEAISSQNIGKKYSNYNKYKYFSNCNCRRNDHISIVKEQTSSENSDLYVVRSILNNTNYIVKETELDELVCGVYETLRRGRHQKVIGYSIFGKNSRYTIALKSMIH